MNLNKKLTLFSLLFCLHFIPMHAQRSMRFTDLSNPVKEAIKLTDMKLYQQASYLLQDYLVHYRQDPNKLIDCDYQTALFYQKKCALHLNTFQAVDDFELFINQTSFESLKQLGKFEFGHYYYEHNSFAEAIKNYEAVRIDMLTNKELIQRNFELGYSYLVTQQLDKVEPYFQTAKNIPGEYFKPGNYYHGLLSYYKRNYTEARSSFSAVKDDPLYKNIVPYYLTEIEYVNGEKEKALQDALANLESSNTLYYKNELNLMVAQIYSEQEEYSKAEAYYKNYIKEASNINDETYFKLGYCQYQQGKLEEAIPNLEAIRSSDDELAQQSKYLLTICYLKTGNKEKTYDFLQKNKLNFADPKRRELVEFTIAKLSYENGDDQEAISKLKSFIQTYPESSSHDEANELLAYLLIKYANFNDAILAINKMKTISYNLKKVYQKANYARGIQMLKDENPDRAIFYFEETRKFPIDTSIIALSYFWLSECHYRLGHYNETLENCDSFLELADSSLLPNYIQKVHLSRAYIYYQNNDTADLNIEYPLATGDTVVGDLMVRMGSVKPNYVPEKIPIVEYDPYVMAYDLPDEKLDFVYKPIPLKPLAMNTEIKREDQSNLLHLSVGNLASLNFGLAYNLDELLKLPLYIDFNRSASKGKIGYQDVNQTHVGVRTNTQVKSHRIDLAFGIDRNKQNYYGYNHSKYNYENTDVKQVFSNVGVQAEITPLMKNRYDIEYSAVAYTGLYSDNHGAGEYTVKADVPISKQIKDDLNAQSDFVLDANIYAVKSKPVQSSSLFSWRPALIKQINDFSIKAGLYPTIGQSFYLVPDLSVSYPLRKQNAIIELAWQEHVRLNTFKQITSLNPFIFNYFNSKQSKNTELFVGIKGNYKSNFDYSFRIGTAIFNQLPLFINDTSGDLKQFNIVYEKRATAFLFDASINYTLNSEWQAGVNLRLRPLIQQETFAKAWHYVPSTFNVFAKLRATKDVTIQSELFVMAGSKAIAMNETINGAYTTILNPGLDLNIHARYAVNRKWNAIIDVNNLFASNYQRWYGYPMYGTNVMVGFVHSFNNLKFE